jgi:hypothetical protein
MTSRPVDVDAGASDSTATTVRAYQAARDEVTRIDATLKAAKERLARCEEAVLSVFEAQGVASVKCDGRLVYLARQVWARPARGREPDLVVALLEVGEDALVERRVGTQRLSAWWREREEEAYDVPESVKALVEVSEGFVVRMKKGT